MLNKNIFKSYVIINFLIILLVGCQQPTTSKLKHRITYETGYVTAPDAIQLDDNTILTNKELPILPDIKGFCFDGWYHNDIKIIPGYKIQKSVDLKAKWVDAFNITFDSQKELPTSFISVPKEKGYALVEKIPVLKNTPEYDFGGWFTVTGIYEDGILSFIHTKFDETVKITSDMTVYAEWIPTI